MDTRADSRPRRVLLSPLLAGLAELFICGKRYRNQGHLEEKFSSRCPCLNRNCVQVSSIIGLLDKLFNEHLIPLVVSTPKHGECIQKKKQTIQDLEAKLNTGLDKVTASVANYVRSERNYLSFIFPSLKLFFSFFMFSFLSLKIFSLFD